MMSKDEEEGFLVGKGEVCNPIADDDVDSDYDGDDGDGDDSKEGGSVQSSRC